MNNQKLLEECKEVYKNAAKTKPYFDKILKKIAKENHADALIVSLKSRKRSIEKAIVDYDGDIKKVKDILRGSIVSRVYGRIDNIVQDIKKNFDVIRIKDRFKSPRENEYRDLLINVKINDVIAEIQVHIKELLKVKNYINHLFYEIARTINAQSNKENRDLFSWEEYIEKKVLDIEKYSNTQAWHRQISLEKGEAPEKAIFMVTHNPGKFKEAKSFIPNLKWIKIDLPEIQSNIHRDIVQKKVLSALEHMDAKIFVEDVALYCDGLKGLPGPLHRFYLERMGVKDFAELVLSTRNNKARAVSQICFAETPSKLHFFEGIAEGVIVIPRGKNGFDWDPIFQPKGYKKTYAELDPAEKNKISMRKIAFDKFLNFLHKKYDYAL